ncbi:MAG: hypothetical protein QNJ68_20680 [Microcoleaceae cyanobacterium MO_207.B10]|nr:hypothetical protein [Microcoleaceae cyanobacterium MO_207.B10]
MPSNFQAKIWAENQRDIMATLIAIQWQQKNLTLVWIGLKIKLVYRHI